MKESIKINKHIRKIKRTWNILNEVINKSSKTRYFSTNFIVNGVEITNKQEISDGFNDFFVNIGPKLARNIVPSENMNTYNFWITPMLILCFLYDVNKKEIIDIVNTLENKLSKDKDDFNMSQMKKIVNQVVDPFLHICISRCYENY